MQTVHIEPKQHAEAAAVTVLQTALAGRDAAWVGAAEASVMTGLPLADAEAALLTLSARFPSELRVTDDGRIEVRFESIAAPPASPAARFLQWLKDRKDAWAEELGILFVMALLMPFFTGGAASVLWLGANGPELGVPSFVIGLALFIGWLWVFVAFAWIAVSIVWMMPWFVVFVALLEAFFPRDGMSVNPGVIVFILAVVPLVGMLWLRVLARILRRKRGPGIFRRLWNNMRGFALGPRKPRIDPLADERRLVAHLHELGGVATTADMMLLFGWTPAQAESQIVRIMLDYGGDVTVSDNGNIVWVFPAFAKGRVNVTEPVAYTHTETGAEPPAAQGRPRFFDCHPSLPYIIAAMLFPSFLVAFMLTPAEVFPDPIDALQKIRGTGSYAVSGTDSMRALLAHTSSRSGFFDSTRAVLGMWPVMLVAFSTVVRIPAFIRNIRAYERQRHLGAWLDLACKAPHSAWHIVDAKDRAVIARLGGHIDEERGRDPKGRYYVHFPDIANARQSAEMMRAGGKLTPSF